MLRDIQESQEENGEKATKEIVLEERNRIRRNTTLFASIAPGSGQFINERNGSGAVFAGIAGATGATLIYSFITANALYEKSNHATTSSEQQYYYDQSTKYLITGIVSSGAYLINMLISGIDNYRSF